MPLVSAGTQGQIEHAVGENVTVAVMLAFAAITKLAASTR
jgi:hypothetical protein